MSHTITGLAYWAKIVGKPGKAYNPGEFSWSIDVSLDAEAKKTILGLGLKVRNKGDERGDYYTFERRELKKKTGVPNKPIYVTDSDGGKFPDGVLIGNKSLVKVKFNVFEVPAFAKLPPHNKEAILEVQILEHVPYVFKDGAQTAKPVNNTSENWKETV